MRNSAAVYGFYYTLAAGSRLLYPRICDNSQISPLPLGSRPLLSSGNEEKVFLSEVRKEAGRHERDTI